MIEACCEILKRCIDAKTDKQRKVKIMQAYSSLQETYRRATLRHLPYEIT